MVAEICACKTCYSNRRLGTCSCEACLLANLSLGTCSWKPLPGNPCLGTSSWEPLLGNLLLGILSCLTLAWESVPGNLAWNLLGTLPENLFLEIFLLVTFSCLGTSCWEPLLGNLFLVTLPGNFAGNLFLGTLLGNLFLGTLAWEALPGNPCLGTSSWEPLLRNALVGRTLAWELVPGNLAWNLLGTLPENPFLKTFLLVTSSCLGTSCWESLLGNLFLVTLPGNFAWELCWEPLPGNLAWEPCLGTCSWEPCLGTSCWESLLGNLFLGTSWEPYLGSFPGNLALELLPCLGTSSCERGFQPCSVRIWLLRGTFLEKGNPSWAGSQPCAVRIWLLRLAPEPLLWLKTPSLRCWGKT